MKITPDMVEALRKLLEIPAFTQTIEFELTDEEFEQLINKGAIKVRKDGGYHLDRKKVLELTSKDYKINGE